MKGKKSKTGKTSGGAMGGKPRLKPKVANAGSYFAAGVAHARSCYGSGKSKS
jgi:hypothetical protein